MKKLMTIAAVALTGAVFAQGIESANIVGYQSAAITAGEWNLKGATFVPVSGATMKLGDISANVAFEFGTDTLQTLNGNGSTKALYTYCGEALAAEFSIDVGWYDFDDLLLSEFTLCNDVELPYGEMAILQAGSSEAAVIYSGAVSAVDQALPITSGVWNLRANCMPVDYTLGDLSANAAFEFGTDTLQTLNGNGSTKALYTYCGEALAAEFSIDVGWYNFDDLLLSEFTLCNAVSIPAGYGFILQAGSDQAVVTVPSPIPQ